jgi:predicted phosphoribosyltransferase
MFRNREDAALQLAQYLKGRVLYDPLVLGIPRGGVRIGAILARELESELDVVQACKFGAPGQPHLVIGAVSESGDIYLRPEANGMRGLTDAYLKEESSRQLATMKKRKELFRTIRPPAPIAGRSVIVTDDEIATGSTMLAALQWIKKYNPYEVIVAVPVASAAGLREVRRRCDDDVWLVSPESFRTIEEFYEGFPPLEDQQAVDLLTEVIPAS